MSERPLGDPEIALEILKLRVAELEQAIRRLAEQDATLTDAEREAIDKAAHAAAQLYPGPDGVALAATLRGLLERTKQPANEPATNLCRKTF